MKPWIVVIALLIALSAALLWWLQTDSDVRPVAEIASPSLAEVKPPDEPGVGELTIVVTVVTPQGTPVKAAKVFAQGLRHQEGTTDENGRWSLTVSANDGTILRAEVGQQSSEALGPVIASGEFTLVVKPAFSAECDVVDSFTREPIQGAQVSVLGRTFPTSENGKVTLTLAPANTPIHIEAPGYLSFESWVDFSRPAAQCLLPISRLSRVEGTVVDNGVPVSSVVVWVEAVGLGGGRSGLVQTDAKGEFGIDTQAGLFRVVGNTRSGLRVDGPAFALAAGETRKGIQLELGARSAVMGTLTRNGVPLAFGEVALVNALTEQQVAATTSDATGKYRFSEATVSRYVLQVRQGTFGGIAGPFAHGETETVFDFAFTSTMSVKGRVEPASAGVRVRCRDSAWTGTARDAATDAQGRFSFEGVSGRVFIDAEGTAGAATATAMPGDDVVLTLSSNPLLVHVRDGAGQPMVDAIVYSQNADTGVLRTDRMASPSGDLTLSLPKGFWLISAQSATGLRTASARVDLQGPTEVSLTFPPAESVSATVIDVATRLPIQGATVALYASGASGLQSPMVTTDARGAFSIAGIDGSGGVSVSREGYNRANFRARHVPATIELTANPAAAPTTPFQYEGVGMVLEVRGDAVAVRQVYEGSPAQRAGALADDLIRTIDGAPASLPVENVLNRIRGAAGSSVTIALERNGRVFEVVMRRRAFVL